MKNRETCAILVIMIALSFNMVDAQSEKKDRLTPVIDSIGNYKDKPVSMVLRLKDVDYTMERITFYDDDNIDIIFDIANYKKNKVLSKDIQTVHPGIRYRVSFTVKGVDPGGLVSGQLTEFVPVYFDKIP
ncbi:MAG TPA: hypothetical protein VF857_10015 [Spirochaetota bacterium]